MKIGVIIYHRNIFERYDSEWIYNCLNKIENQTFGDFLVVELDFGGTEKKLYNGEKKSYFYSEKIDNLSMALNKSFDICFNTHNLDLVFNINLDDDYELNRFEKQLECFKKTNADVVTSNFHFTDQNLNINMTTNFCYHTEDILEQNKIIDFEFNRNNNIIGFPGCLITKKFWSVNDGFPTSLNYRGREDFELWIESRKKDCKFYIIKEPLFKYRVHNSSISKKINL